MEGRADAMQIRDNGGAGNTRRRDDAFRTGTRDAAGAVARGWRDTVRRD